MRIVSGSRGGRLLKAPPGRSTRPTPDRVREALFSILGDRVPGARFLDLFAGTGANGLEALSRGARTAVFVECARAALAVLRENIARLELEAQSEVLTGELPGALSRLAALDERQARVVELRFFGGLTMEQVAEVLGISKRSAESDWTMARAWLHRELKQAGEAT